MLDAWTGQMIGKIAGRAVVKRRRIQTFVGDAGRGEAVAVMVENL